MLQVESLFVDRLYGCTRRKDREHLYNGTKLTVVGTTDGGCYEPYAWTNKSCG